MRGALFAVSAVVASAQVVNQCTYSFANASFDLTPLARASSYYKVVDKSNNAGSSNYSYYINICANIDPLILPNSGALTVASDCSTTYPGAWACNSNNGNNPACAKTMSFAPAFQYSEKSMNPGTYDKCHRLGNTLSDSNPPVWGFFDAADPSRGVSITYGGGDGCPANRRNANPARALRIWLECVPDAYNIPDQELVVETNDCFYEIFVPSAYGCPTTCPLNNKQLCSNHGLCGFDTSKGVSKCFCNAGYSGADCSAKAGAAAGLTNVGGVLIGVGIFLLVTMGFLGFLWYRIRSLRLDPQAYSALRAGPDDKAAAYTVNSDGA